MEIIQAAPIKLTMLIGLGLKFALALGVLASLVLGCSTLVSTSPQSDEVAIYQAVFRRLATSDDTFGGTLEKRTIYIIRATNDAAGDPSLQKSNSIVLSKYVQDGLSTALADLPSKIVWVDSFDQVKIDQDTRSVVDHGVIITLGNITFQNNAKALVPGSIYIASLAAGGRTYILEKQAGVWTITGTTGYAWMS